jgi:gliding motility-associated-like protein
MNIRIFILVLLLQCLACQALGQQIRLLRQGSGLSYTNSIPYLWPGSKNEIWPGIGLPFPLVQVKNDSAFSFFKNETDLVPYSNPLVGAYSIGDKTILLHGFLPSYTMGIFGPCNGGVLIKSNSTFSLKNSINTSALSNVKEKFWYNSAKARLDSSVWIAADTGFRRLNLHSLETKILKDPTYQGIALYNKTAASGEHWAGFRNDYGIWCILWGDTNARIISGVDLGTGPNVFVNDIAESPSNDTLFTASGFLGNNQSPYHLFRKKGSIFENLNIELGSLPDSLAWVEVEKDGTIWVTARKKAVFQIRNGVVRTISLPDSLSSFEMKHLVIDGSNQKWLSLEGNGLVAINDLKPSFSLPNEKRICVGSSFAFQNQTQTIGRGVSWQKWDFGFGDTSLAANVEHTFRRPGKYPVTLYVRDLNGSENQFTDSIWVDDLPSGEIKTEWFSKEFCKPTTVWIESIFPSSWLLPDGNTTNRDTVTTEKNGVYIATIHNGACERKDTVYQSLNQNVTIPIQLFNDNVEIKTDSFEAILPVSLDFKANPGNFSICPPSWFVNNSAKGNGYQINYTFNESGRQEIKLVSESIGGCSVESIRILFLQDAKLQIPNLVTLNGDGSNEQFYIPQLPYYPNNELFIFNRWGKEVFRAIPYRNNWPPADLIPGTYFYRLKAESTVFSGWVEVVR